MTSPRSVGFAVLTVSDTRDEASDLSGRRIVELVEAAGHAVVRRRLEPDEPAAIGAAMEELVATEETECVVVTGGTGLAPRDQSVEALEPLFERLIPGFGELFRALSYEQVGVTALLSRATAGVIRERPVFLLPGSPRAVELAVERLILPAIGHLVEQIRGA